MDGIWTCHACTFINNKPLGLVCDVCLTERSEVGAAELHRDYAQMEAYRIESNAPAPPASPPPLPVAHVAEVAQVALAVEAQQAPPHSGNAERPVETFMATAPAPARPTLAEPKRKRPVDTTSDLYSDLTTMVDEDSEVDSDFEIEFNDSEVVAGPSKRICLLRGSARARESSPENVVPATVIQKDSSTVAAMNSVLATASAITYAPLSGNAPLLLGLDAFERGVTSLSRSSSSTMAQAASSSSSLSATPPPAPAAPPIRILPPVTYGSPGSVHIYTASAEVLNLGNDANFSDEFLEHPIEMEMQYTVWKHKKLVPMNLQRDVQNVAETNRIPNLSLSGYLFPRIHRVQDDLYEFWITVSRNELSAERLEASPKARFVRVDLCVKASKKSSIQYGALSSMDEYIRMYLSNSGKPFFETYRSTSLGEFANITSSQLEVPGTSDITPHEALGPSFGLQLFDYQLRTLSWMRAVEDGVESFFYSPNYSSCIGSELVKENDVVWDATAYRLVSLESVVKKENVRKGIIADKPGVGKTITTLALCHTRKHKNEEYLYKIEQTRFISRGTVIFVPNNISGQWQGEIKRCLGMNIKLIVLKGKKDYMQTSFLDVLQADLILVTHQFLTNTSYKGRTAKNPGRNLSHFFPPCLCADTPLSACKDFVEKCPKGDWALTWCHFHRVIVDEFHEISDKDGSTRAQFRLMQGDTMWGLTGTPRFESTATIMEFAEFLNMNVNSWRNETVEAVRFIQHRVRRNDPDIKLPDPVFETIKVTQTVLEAAFYKSCANLGTEALLKLCSHYQIGNEAGGIGDYEAMPIKQVTEMVQSSRAKSIVKLEREVDEVRKEQARLMRKLGSETAPSKRDILADRMTRLRRELEKSEVQLALTRSQFNYFSNFVDSYLKAAEKVECNICLDEDVEGDIGIIPCGHAFCFPCANDVVKSHGLCPNCRQTVSAADVMKVPGPAKAKEAGTVFEEAQTSEQSNAQEGDGTLDPDLFGSKIRELVAYLQREMTLSEDFRFIVFIQFSDLADLVSAALKTYGITTARLKSGWMAREGALKKFRAGLTTEEKVVGFGVEEDAAGEAADNEAEDARGKGKGKAKAKVSSRPKIKPVKVLMLSAMDSVSGLNLTEATHCIILHPFHANIDSYAIASEKQGIARVLRNGQKKSVKIVRFFVENTVEAEIHEKRMKVHGIVDALSQEDEKEDKGHASVRHDA